MTEAEWLVCAHTSSMLEFLRDRTSDRKVRLFGCECCRRVWDEISPHRRCLVIATEQYADEIISKGDLIQTCTTIPSGKFTAADNAVMWLWNSLRCIYDKASVSAKMAAAFRVTSERSSKQWEDACSAELLHQVRLIRDIFGNPFRTINFNLTWRTDTALSLAQQMYDSRDFGAMPILADALQDAGCDDDDILNHCRTEGVHVRGCWVVDLVLGKE